MNSENSKEHVGVDKVDFENSKEHVGVDKVDCDCICDQTKVKVTCGYCKQKFEKELHPDAVRTIHCLKHRGLFVCGPPGYTCPECSDQGWIVVSGYGGPPYAKNSKTGETIDLITRKPCIR